LLLAGFIEFLAGFIKLSHTILLPMCSLLLADCDDSRCGATSRLLALFSWCFCCCFYYDICCCSHLRHINRRHVWAGHLLDAARSAAARRHTCLSKCANKENFTILGGKLFQTFTTRSLKSFSVTGVRAL